MSQGSFLAPKISPKWGPNRIIDAEGVKKPLDRHLGGYPSALRGILAALGRVLSAIRSLKVGPVISNPPTPERKQPAGRGSGGEEGLASKNDNSKALRALRHRGLGGL